MAVSWNSTISAIRSRFSRWRTQHSSKPKGGTGPLGLSPEALEALDRLRSTPAWQHYSQAWAAVYDQQLAALIRPLPHDGYLFQCGVLFALERAANLVDDLLTVRDAPAKRTAEPAVADARAFLNSVWWDAYRARAAKTSSS